MLTVCATASVRLAMSTEQVTPMTIHANALTWGQGAYAGASWPSKPTVGASYAMKMAEWADATAPARRATLWTVTSSPDPVCPTNREQGANKLVKYELCTATADTDYLEPRPSSSLGSSALITHGGGIRRCASPAANMLTLLHTVASHRCRRPSAQHAVGA